MLRLDEVTSTQDVARGLPVGSIVIADHQTAGRGRLDRRWQAPPRTALLVSFVLEPNPLLSLAAGLAAAEACGSEVRLKWPNDLLIDERKLGGILVENTPRIAICGIGINLTWAPLGAARLDQPRDVLLERLRGSLRDWTGHPPKPSSPGGASCRPRSAGGCASRSRVRPSRVSPRTSARAGS